MADASSLRASFGRRLWRRARKNIATFVSLVFVLVLAAAAAFAPWLAPHDPLEQDPAATLQPPSASYWMGTDQVGRDIFSRVVHGSRLSLAIGLTSVLLGLTVGVGIGL